MTPHSAAPRPAHLLTRALRSVTTLLLLGAWGTTSATFAATIPAPYELATWRGFRASAVSYTFDDNSPKQFSVAQPMFDAKGLHATFFCIAGNLSAAQWATINNASSKGHEIGSHSLTHPDLTTLTDDDVAMEEFGSKDLIESQTGKKCVSIAYPYCTVPKRSITSQYYAFARSCNGSLVPSTPTDFLSIGSMGPDGDMSAKADNAASSGSWLVWLLHGIDDDPACCPIASPVLQANLDHVTSDPDKWWVETFGNVARYIQERNAAVLTVVSNEAASITLQLTHGLDNTIFDYPLTLRRSMPVGWAAAAVTQNGVSVPSQIVDGKLVFDAVPNGGDIVLARMDPPQGQSNIGADDPNIQYVGRFDMTNPSAPGFDWSLCTIRAKFQGTSCSVKLDGSGKYFDVFIDGAMTSPIISTSGGLQTFVVASGLSDSVHSIAICRRAEATAGKNIFRGFVLDSGKTLVAPGPGPSRKIEFIGDSYTCGYGVETTFGEPFTNATENARLSYAGLMASHYNADCMITARSGHGMVRNYNSPNQTSPDPVPFYYPRTCGSVANNDYDFTWQPDVVVVVLGINDFSTTPYPSEEQYVGGYSSFITTLRGHYPDAHILCTWWSGMPSFASDYVAAAVSASGDSKVHFANVPFNIDFPADYGADYHPNLTGQTKIANAFIPVFDSIMGMTWGGDTTPIPDPPVMKARYAFEGDSLDISGSGNNGTANALTYVMGIHGAQAAQFNGTSSHVVIPRSVTDDFTVAMWVKTTDTAGAANAQWWAGKGLVDGEVGGGGADWGTSIVNGKFVLGVGSTSGDTTLASSVNINDGAWHHVVATRSNISGAMAVYVDGVLRGSGTGPTGSRTLPPSLRIGSLQTGNNFLNGTLDDVRLYDRVLSATEVAELARSPYGGTPWPVPGMIQAEDYDIGGPGFAYNDDDTGNNGGQYRSDGVDLEVCAEGGYNVGWTGAGEWLEYTVNVAHTGSFGITLRAASQSLPIQAHVEFDGVNVTGLMTAPATGGWQSYTNVTSPNVTLTAGQHVMRVYFDGEAWNLNHITLTANPLPAPQNLTATGGGSQIALSWNAVDGAASYTIQRSASSGGPYTDLATGISATNYVNTYLGHGETWHYQVAAQGGEPTAPVSATTYTTVENWRLANFDTIANSGNAADSADPDGDGWTNEQEYVGGTDPNDRVSLLRFDAIQASGSDMQLTFPSVPGRTYRVERSDTLLEDSWSTVQDNIPGTGGTVQITDLAGAGQPKRFYRIVVAW